MYEQVEKPKGNKSRAVANSVAQKKRKGKQGFGFVDKRPEVILHSRIRNDDARNQTKNQENKNGVRNYYTNSVQPGSKVLQGAFTARVDVQPPVGEALYSGNNILVTGAALSEKDRPSTGLEGNKQGKHIFAWTERIETLTRLAESGVNAEQYASWLLKLSNQEGEKSLVELMFYIDNYIRQNHETANWGKELSLMTEGYLNEIQKTSIARVKGPSTYGNEDKGRDAMRQFETDVINGTAILDKDLELALSRIIDTRGQIPKQLSQEDKSKAYRDIMTNIEMSYPNLYILRGRDIAAYIESSFKLF